MNVLGISCYYHDAAACLVVDGNVVAGIAEERLSRTKHDNAFPERASRWCLDWAGIDIDKLDAIAFYEKPLIKFERILSQHVDGFPRSAKVFRENIGSWFSYKLKLRDTLRKQLGYSGPLYFIPHHMSHAASAFFLSGFDSAAVVTIDGVGEWATTTVGFARGNDIDIHKEIRFPHSLGLLYSAITAYLGFEVNDAEYKVMGYAAYGKPERFEEQFGKLVTLHADGSFTLNMSYFSYVWSDRMYNRALVSLFGMPPRKKESGIQQDYADVAAGLQKTLETAVFHVMNAAGPHKTKKLCFSGGVALNSVLNGKLLSHTPFTDVFIPPDPGDAGGAMGAALYVARKLDKAPKTRRFFPDIGPSYSDEQIRTTIEAAGLPYTTAESDRILVKRTAALLARQNVVGWFRGRAEWGPRALGFRSILASPMKAGMKDIINKKVKHRELFRPFAPAILDRFVGKYFRTDTSLPLPTRYMLFVYPFTKIGAANAPATTHVDGTGRLQVVSASDNPLYYDLIDAFRKITGVPVVLNTSFNVRGEPIVCSPRDAIECFMKTDIDYLVMGRFIVEKHHGKRTS